MIKLWRRTWHYKSTDSGTSLTILVIIINYCEDVSARALYNDNLITKATEFPTLEIFVASRLLPVSCRGE